MYKEPYKEVESEDSQWSAKIEVDGISARQATPGLIS